MPSSTFPDQSVPLLPACRPRIALPPQEEPRHDASAGQPEHRGHRPSRSGDLYRQRRFPGDDHTAVGNANGLSARRTRSPQGDASVSDRTSSQPSPQDGVQLPSTLLPVPTWAVTPRPSALARYINRIRQWANMPSRELVEYAHDRLSYLLWNRESVVQLAARTRLEARYADHIARAWTDLGMQTQLINQVFADLDILLFGGSLHRDAHTYVDWFGPHTVTFHQMYDPDISVVDTGGFTWAKLKALQEPNVEFSFAIYLNSTDVWPELYTGKEVQAMWGSLIHEMVHVYLKYQCLDIACASGVDLFGMAQRHGFPSAHEHCECGEMVEHGPLFLCVAETLLEKLGLPDLEAQMVYEVCRGCEFCGAENDPLPDETSETILNDMESTEVGEPGWIDSEHGEEEQDHLSREHSPGGSEDAPGSPYPYGE